WLESAAASATTNARVAAAEMREIERAFNGGSRMSEVLHCSSRHSLPRRSASASAKDATRCRETDDQEHEKQHEEQPRQELGDGERRAGNCREPEQGGKQPNHQEHERHVQHDSRPPPAPFAKGVPCNTVEAWTHFCSRLSRKPNRG